MTIKQEGTLSFSECADFTCDRSGKTDDSSSGTHAARCAALMSRGRSARFGDSMPHVLLLLVYLWEPLVRYKLVWFQCWLWLELRIGDIRRAITSPAPPPARVLLWR